MKRISILTTLLVLANLLIASCGSDPTAPDDGDVQPPGWQTISIAPYDILQHGFDLSGVWANGLGSVTVAEQGLAFVSTAAGRYLLPTNYEGDLTDVHVTPDGTIVITARATETTRAKVFWFANGIRRQTGMTHDYVAISCSHAAQGDWPLYVLQDAGQVSWFTGASLQGVGSAPTTVAHDIWAHASGTHWVAAVTGVIVGGPTGEYSHVLRDGRYEAVSAVAIDTVLAVGGPPGAWRIQRLDGGDVFRPVYDSPDRLWDLCWLDREFAIAVGQDGATVTWDGAGWIPRRVDPARHLRAVAAWRESGQPRAIAVGDSGATFTFEDGQWVGGRPQKLTCRDLMGVSSELMFALDEGDLMKFDGEWQRMPAAGELWLRDFCCLAADEIWAIGKQDIDNFVARFDGSVWSMQWLSSLEEANDIWAVGDSRVFVACDYGTVYSNVSGVFAPMSAIQPVQNLNAIWGASATSVYVVGDQGVVSHWDGTDWTAMNSGTDENLIAIWGSSDQNIVALGQGQTMLHFDGSQWNAVDYSAAIHWARRVWCDAPDNIWLVGTGGEIAHYDGATWEERDSPFAGAHAMSHTGVWGCPEGVFIAAENGILMRYLPPPDDLLTGLGKGLPQ